MSSTMRVRVGLLGSGAIAQVVHLPILSELPGVELRAVSDVYREKAAVIGGRFEVPLVTDRDEEVFASEEIDAVVLCTPSHLHEAQAIAAMRAGKHVLVERPLALDSRGAERVIAVAEETGKVLMVALNNRYRDDFAALRPFARGGELGQIALIKASWLNRRIRAVRPTWRHRHETAGGGVLIDLGTQLLDLCLWTLGEGRVERVVAHTRIGEGMEVEDTASVMAWMDSGTVLSLDMSWSLLAERDRRSFDVLGTDGSASIGPLSVHKEIEHGVLDVTPMLGGANENLYTASYRKQLLDFVDAIRGERSAEPPREQIDVVRIVETAYRSASEGRVLEVEARD